MEWKNIVNFKVVQISSDGGSFSLKKYVPATLIHNIWLKRDWKGNFYHNINSKEEKNYTYKNLTLGDEAPKGFAGPEVANK